LSALAAAALLGPNRRATLALYVIKSIRQIKNWSARAAESLRVRRQGRAAPREQWRRLNGAAAAAE
jgi:hypothetical protein